MSTDDHRESLAAQAAAWVPPWERPARTPRADPPQPDASVAEPGDPSGSVPAQPVDGTDGSLAARPGGDPDRTPVAQESPGDGTAESPVVPELPGESEQSPPAVDAPIPDPAEDDDDPIDPDIPIPDAPAPSGPPETEGVPVDSPSPLIDDDVVLPTDASAPVEQAGSLPAEPLELPAVDNPTRPVPAAPPDRVTVPAQPAAGGDAGNRAPDASGPALGGGAAARTLAPAALGDGGGAGSADPARVVDDHELRAALEAILLVVDEPVAEMVLAQILEQPTERVAAMLQAVSAGYTAAGHGFDLRRAAGGWRLYTRPEYAAYVERFVLDGQSMRLTQAALETLAVVAYKQPVSRSRISAIRGVNCDGVMRTLVSRGLVEECGTEPESGAFLYRTTVLFLEKLGLNSVDQLPPLAPFLPDDVEEVLDAQR